MFVDGDYVDLTLNPERFTGYIGPSAHRVWSAIYSENCFGLTQEVLNEPVPDITQAKGECLEQRVYYKIISGELSLACLSMNADGACKAFTPVSQPTSVMR